MAGAKYEIRHIKYNEQWETEYLKEGFPKVWLADFPEMFETSNGVHKPNPLPRESLYCLADYALMYLLRKSRGISSTTYFEIGANPRKPSPEAEARRRTVQAKIRRWMGNEDFEKLEQAFWGKAYKGEPDLFCWNPRTSEWFFAEAKGPKDSVKDCQEEWFKTCRDVLPNVRLFVYFLKPERI